MPIPDPIAFTIFGVDIRWYGVLIACAIGIAVALTCLRAPKHNLTADQMLDVLIFAIPGGILGARIYYVIFEWSYYGQHLDQILNFRGGGLAIHGGLIGSFLVAYLVCRHKNVKFLDGMDLCTGPHRTDHRTGAGHRALGQLFQFRGARRSDRSALGDHGRRRQSASHVFI